MAQKTAHLTLDSDPASEGLRFTATAGSGHSIVLDNVVGDTGMRPAELVPLALAGCTAMDVISILRKKRQAVNRYEVQATGTQQDEPPAIFTRIDVLHLVEGDVETAAVRRAIELSATKYCSVGSTLATGITEIHHGYVVRRPGPEGVVEESDEVVVEGGHVVVDG